jgi:predicted  nucleic acid-binding Zn-ribbon protein
VSDEIAKLKKANFILSKSFHYATSEVSRLQQEHWRARAQCELLQHDIDVYKQEIVNLQARAEEELKKSAQETYEAKLETKHAKRELNQIKKHKSKE